MKLKSFNLSLGCVIRLEMPDGKEEPFYFDGNGKWLAGDTMYVTGELKDFLNEILKKEKVSFLNDALNKEIL